MKKLAIALCLALASQSALAVTQVYQTSSKKTYQDRYLPEPVDDLGSCDAEHFAWMVGRGSGPLHYLSNDQSRVRVIVPGHSYTMEYVPDRLNFHINQQGLVERVSCG